MGDSFIIGLDYGSESARAVLIDVKSGLQIDSCQKNYQHGIMSDKLPDGTMLPRNWALQDASDYLDVAETLLQTLGHNRQILSIGIGFTASSPLPATQSGQALSQLRSDDPHAYVKLWKHGAAQRYADSINEKGGAYLEKFGGKVSGEWLLAKAMQIAEESPETWQLTDKFIEAGDWLVWQLTGNEARSLGFAAYKAQYSEKSGYPRDIQPDLHSRLAEPHRIGSAAGNLTEAWRIKTGMKGNPVVAVAVIDSHVVLPAVGGVDQGCLVGALGTSAAYLLLSKNYQPLPNGIEGVAWDGSIQNLWCYEAGQASFGDTLAWFVDSFPRAKTSNESFSIYNSEAQKLNARDSTLVALDWWNGNRVPLRDSSLSGLLLGLTRQSTSTALYRALIESLCFGTRSIMELFNKGEIEINRVIMTSGLALNNPLLIQIMADVTGRTIEVPELKNSTAIGAAIHGAVAASLINDYPEGTSRFGARSYRIYTPEPEANLHYQQKYAIYQQLSASHDVRDSMHKLHEL